MRILFGLSQRQVWLRKQQPQRQSIKRIQSAAFAARCPSSIKEEPHV
ncbi:hypothetical protein HOLDEFILI_00936 [Holdemania filiformis DSM 12042]|uniref:Uncharacterized protein n=1 Tax=Holdemania filiformis DSM 12042 TaxID=545696 RepID=B9Y555_9FIRM|nr:hypothetical protein HOLDEFILI_00936 [Holdemania filiformis DSM 12042]